MREMMGKRGSLRRLATQTKLVYTVFLAFATAGFVTSFLLYDDGPGWSPTAATAYYAGDAPAPAAHAEAQPPEPGGPAIDLDGLDGLDGLDDSAGVAPVAIHAPKSARVLLETTHRHLYMIAVVWLIISHLFLLTSLPAPVRLGVPLVTAAGAAAHVAAPWAIRFLSPSLGWTMGASGALMALPFLGMVGYSLWEMWLARRA